MDYPVVPKWTGTERDLPRKMEFALWLYYTTDTKSGRLTDI